MTDNKAITKNLGYVGSTPGERKSDEWYTPDIYIEAVRASFESGSITLDPFSDSIANERIDATHWIGEDEDSLVAPWGKHDNAFMNPPYSAKVCKHACAKFVDQYMYGNLQEGIILVNNSTETKYFQNMLNAALAICLTDHRISFWNANNKCVSSNTRGQCFLYFGTDHSRFTVAMNPLGSVLIVK